MLDEFVGLAWQDKGRGPEAYDCWGLMLAVYAAWGVELPAYSDSYVTACDRDEIGRLIAGELGPWREVPAGQEAPLDGVLLTEAGVPCHIGIVERPGFMLHMASNTNSVIEPYTSAKWRRRVAGFYRHESLA